MEITNDATTLTSVGVNVNTQLLSDEMKKRLFFYVEETHKENNETVDRTYVGASGRYFYTLLPGEHIYMSDTEYNTAQAAIADWAKDGVALCGQLGLLVGANGTFSPTDTATRAMGAVILQRLDEADLRPQPVENGSNI